jgi:hypothetical protein
MREPDPADLGKDQGRIRQESRFIDDASLVRKDRSIRSNSSFLSKPSSSIVSPRYIVARHGRDARQHAGVSVRPGDLRVAARDEYRLCDLRQP